jgi:hypothetical protein
MRELPPQVALLLAKPIPLDRVRIGRTIAAPIVGVTGAPLSRAVAAHLPILRVAGELLTTVLLTTTPLTGWLRAHSLLRVETGCLKITLTKTATPLAHLLRVKRALFRLTLSWRQLDWKTKHPAPWFARPCAPESSGLTG